MIRQLDVAKINFDLISEPSADQFKVIIDSLTDEIVLKLDGPYVVWQEVSLTLLCSPFVMIP